MVAEPENIGRPARLRRQLLGSAILLKALLPPIIMTTLFVAVVALAAAVHHSLNDTISRIERHSAQTQVHIAEIKREGVRLYGEIKKIQTQTKRFAGDVNQAIKPIRSSVVNVWKSLKSVSTAIEKAINAIIKSVNVLILAKKLKLKPIKLPPIRVPKLSLPSLNLGLDLEPDLRALKAMQKSAIALQEDLKTTAQDLVAKLSFWLSVIRIILLLAVIWFLLVIIGFFMRIPARIAVGMRLLKCEKVDNALLYF